MPQGRRVWPSLTVDEHLRLAAGNRRDASWTLERVYGAFPRLAERRDNGGSQLSGGEQQMLAISRALLSDPKLLVMDEPTEGLAPVIVEHVENMLMQLGAEGEMAILVIEHAQALITKNRMRVDLVAEFFVRVGGTRDLVAAAAQTLGRRTLQPDGLRELPEGKFTGALRSITAQMTLEDMHERRGDYADRVKAMASESLAANGLELESVAIVDLDQTSLEFFDPSNAFDAEGLTALTQSIETAARCATRSNSRPWSTSATRTSRPSAACSKSTVTANMRGWNRSARLKSAARRSALI